MVDNVALGIHLLIYQLCLKSIRPKLAFLEPLHTNTRTLTHTHAITHSHIHTHTHTYIYVCKYIYIYIYCRRAALSDRVAKTGSDLEGKESLDATVWEPVKLHRFPKGPLAHAQDSGAKRPPKGSPMRIKATGSPCVLRIVLRFPRPRQKKAVRSRAWPP